MNDKRHWEMVVTYREPTGMYQTEVYQGLTIEQINDAMETKFEHNRLIGLSMRSMPMDAIAMQSHNKYLNGEGL